MLSILDSHQRGALTQPECLGLLATRTVGRLSMSTGGLPWVVPVSFRADGERVVLHVDENVARSACDVVVAFETDDIDDDTRQGWSVVIVGVGRIDEPGFLVLEDALIAGRRLGLLSPWPQAGEAGEPGEAVGRGSMPCEAVAS
jgi:hypothetical protein